MHARPHARSHTSDIMRACGHRVTLERGPRRDLKNVVRQLEADSRPSQKRQAMGTIETLCFDGGLQGLAAIAAAGAIPQLVRLLGTGSTAEVQQSAAGALLKLAEVAEHAAIITAAGAVPPLVQLLGPGSNPTVQQNAAGTLGALAASAETAAAIAAAGAIPPLLEMLDSGSTTTDGLTNTIGALRQLASKNIAVAATIASAGAFPAVIAASGVAWQWPLVWVILAGSVVYCFK
jgi:hypothetical protein